MIKHNYGLRFGIWYCYLFTDLLRKLADNPEDEKLLKEFRQRVARCRKKIRDFNISQLLEILKDFDWYPELKAKLVTEIFPKNPIFEETLLAADFVMGKMVFVTPEYKGISKAGGVSVMMVDLCERLVELGEEVIVITPYYNIDRNGRENYLKTEHLRNVHIDMDHRYHFGVHYKEINGVQLYLLHNAQVFPKVYPDVKFRLKISLVQEE